MSCWSLYDRALLMSKEGERKPQCKDSMLFIILINRGYKKITLALDYLF